MDMRGVMGRSNEGKGCFSLLAGAISLRGFGPVASRMVS